MKKILFLIFLLYPVYLCAQTYRHIGVESGLSSKRIYAIQKDKKGYMWFLTHEGIDRYNGKEFKQYILKYNGKELSSLHDLSWLHLDQENTLWVIGRKGRVFKYDEFHDQFIFVYQVPDSFEENAIPVTSSFIDDSNRIWLSCKGSIYLYDIWNESATTIKRYTEGEITQVIQRDSNHYFVGTDLGIHYGELKGQTLELTTDKSLADLVIQVNDLYYDQQTNQLFIGTFQKGVFVFNTETKECFNSDNKPNIDISITRIKALNEEELLVATDGIGIYKLNIRTHTSTPFIVANYSENNRMTGNEINDIYIDKEQRIWIANYPIGITIWDDKYARYRWFRHSLGNLQSLLNDRVNAIIEDNEGDLWFATSNGISLYNAKNDTWRSFLSSFNATSKNTNNIFLSLCEISPGVILAGGSSSNIYRIQKNRNSVDKLPMDQYYKELSIRPNKHIRSIIKDSQGNIWVGGYYSLKRLNLKEKRAVAYPDISTVTTIIERDSKHMWIGTTKGVYLLNKETGISKQLTMPSESNYVYSLCQTKNDQLYIGTNGSGLLVYNIKDGTYEHYRKDNSTLLSNNIYTLLTDEGNNIIFSSEVGLTRFYPNEKDFHNWTKEQGLVTNHFNSNSGTYRKNGDFIFGSNDGAVEFYREMQLPRDYPSKMVFSDFKLFYQSVYPSDPDSPLEKDIDDTEFLQLNYNQNIFSLKVSSINYDYPSNVLYSWKLEGFYDSWSRPSSENVIRFTNLGSGAYKLHVRAISNENQTVLQERFMKITIKQPFWRSSWAVLFYLLILGAIASVFIRLYNLRRQRKIADEKFQFFINTAHDIRTPLTLIKAPLEDIHEKEGLSDEGKRNMNTAIRNVNVLLRLTTNLLNFERIDLYSSNLYISEHELNTFMADIIRSFHSYADVKNISFTYNSSFRFLNVWFDREKMDSILKNLISNALKYTPEGGEVHVIASETTNNWSIEVKDTGIGIPAAEQKKIFKVHFRGSNAINSKITGSGIGMVLVAKMVKFHKGKITLNSVEQKGTSIKVTFPKGYNHFNKAHLALPVGTTSTSTINNIEVPSTFTEATQRKKPKQGQRILIAEDNDELRGYLHQTLSEEYSVVVVENGKEALGIVKEYNPDLVISDIMMPEMRGDELCHILKNDIDTSHIPIMLLTALNDEKNILKGLQTGADEYIIKPFNIGILKASIANLLTNRAILRSKFANLDNAPEEDGSCMNCATELDWKFINSLKEHVEKNIDDPSFNIDTLASLMYMSRTSLYSKIKALTDLAPSDYVRNIRLNKAAELLKEGKHNVTEVAELTGFNDAKYFREVFKKHFNVSPSKYKG